MLLRTPARLPKQKDNSAKLGLLAIVMILAGCMLTIIPATAQDVVNNDTLAETSAETQEQGTTSETADAAINVLLAIIKDEAARQRLIERLSDISTPSNSSQDVPGAETTDEESATTAVPQDESSTATETGTTDEDNLLTTELPLVQSRDIPTAASEFAANTKQFAESFYSGLTNFFRDLAGTRFVAETLTEEKLGRLGTASLALAGTIAAVILLILLGRLIFQKITRRWTEELAAPANDVSHREPRAVGLLAMLVGLEFAWLMLVVAGGYLVSMLLFDPGQINIEQSLLLNAILAAGIAMIVLNLLTHPSRPAITIFRLPYSVAELTHRHARNIILFLTFGLIFIVPLSSTWANFATGRALRVIVLSAAAIWALIAIRDCARHAKTVLTENQSSDEATPAPVRSKPTNLIPLLMSLGIVAIWVVGIAQPQLLLPVIGAAIAQILVVLTAATLVYRLLRAMEGSRPDTYPAPDAPLTQQFQNRVQGLLPIIAQFLKLALTIVAALFLADAIGLIDLRDLLSSPKTADYSERVVSALVVLISAALVWIVVSSIIDRRLSKELLEDSDDARKRTILALFRNAFAIVVIVFALMTSLSQLGLDIAPLLAGAGVVGLAIGFGAQKLVQDVITGIFIQIENAFNVGDVITVAGITGSVEQLSVRSVGMRDINGTYHIIPFSAVDTVSNSTRKFGYHVSEIGVGYGEDISKVKQAMEDAFTKLKDGDLGRYVQASLEMHGVTALADSSVNVRARIKTRAGRQWEVGRAYTEIVKTIFDERNIEIPFPHRTIIHQTSQPEETRKPTRPKTRKPAAAKPAPRRRKPKDDEISTPDGSDID